MDAHPAVSFAGLAEGKRQQKTSSWHDPKTAPPKHALAQAGIAKTSLFLQWASTRSEMCLAPAGWELWSVRFFEAILLGCIPVLVTDDIQLPFQGT